MRTIAALLALGLLLGSAAPAAAQQTGRPVSGKVDDVNPAARTIELGGETYHVPAGIDLSRISAGESIILHWEHRGGRMVVTEIEERAAVCGSVNTVVVGPGGTLRGSTSDGLGVLGSLKKKVDVKGRSVVILGAGGAARSAALRSGSLSSRGARCRCGSSSRSRATAVRARRSATRSRASGSSSRRSA